MSDPTNSPQTGVPTLQTQAPPGGGQVNVPEALQSIGLKLRRPVMTDLILLKKIDSPLTRVSTGQDGEVQVTGQCDLGDVLEALYIFTTPPAQARAILAQGRASFREAALNQTGDLMGIDFLLSVQAIMEEIIKNMAQSQAAPIPA